MPSVALLSAFWHLRIRMTGSVQFTLPAPSLVWHDQAIMLTCTIHQHMLRLSSSYRYPRRSGPSAALWQLQALARPSSLTPSKEGGRCQGGGIYRCGCPQTQTSHHMSRDRSGEDAATFQLTESPRMTGCKLLHPTRARTATIISTLHPR